MLSEEPAPAAPTMNSWVKRSAGVLIGAVAERRQTRAGREVAPSQLKRRGSASRLAWPISAWLGMLRENEPNTVPSRGACAERKLTAGMLAAAGMFCTMIVGWPGMCLAR
jgi:hypothetical protein